MQIVVFMQTSYKGKYCESGKPLSYSTGVALEKLRYCRSDKHTMQQVLPFANNLARG